MYITGLENTAYLLRDFVADQFESLYMPRFRPSTRVRYRGLLQQSILPAFGTTRLDDVEVMAVRRFSAALLKRGVQVKGHIALLKTLLRAAHECGLIRLVPSLPKLYSEQRKPIDCPPREEAMLLLAKAGGWFRVCLALGLLALLALAVHRPSRSASFRPDSVSVVTRRRGGCLDVREGTDSA